MKVRVNEELIYLRGETEEEKRILNEMYKHGVVASGGGSELTICSKLFFGSESSRPKSKRMNPDVNKESNQAQKILEVLDDAERGLQGG